MSWDWPMIDDGLLLVDEHTEDRLEGGRWKLRETSPKVESVVERKRGA